MKGSVDSRVVEMHFDNSDFMGKIKETIEALEQLNAQIDKLNASKGLAGGLDTNGISAFGSAIESIKYRLSTIGVIGASVTNRLTNDAITAAGKITSGINAVFNQIKQGGMQRAQNIEQANFLLEGLGANVTKVMEDVNYAVEGTAYGLDEAAKASAVFFAAGVKDGDKMKTALRAISGVAAMSGKSYSEMAEVFQDAASKGSFMTQELRRIQLQGIAADQYLKKFFDHINEGKDDIKDIPEDVQKAVKSITSGTKTSSEDLEKMLRDGKISFEVFAAAMDWAFGKHATKANETFSGSLANLKTAFSRLGEAFITPGMKGLIPLLNRMREGVSAFTSQLKLLAVPSFSKFMNDFGKSFGNLFKQANKLKIFEELGIIVSNALQMLMLAFRAIKTEFVKVFPDASVKNLSTIIKSLADLSTEFFATHMRLEGLHKAFYIFFKVLKIGYNIISGAFSLFKKLVSVLIGIISPTESATDALQSLVDFLDGKTKATAFWDFLGAGVEKAASLVKKGVGFIIDTFEGLLDGFTSWEGDINAFSLAIINALTFFGGQRYLRKVKFPFEEWKKDFTLLQNFLDPNTRSGIIASFAELLKFPEKVTKVLGSTIDYLGAMQKEIDAKILKHIAVSLLALAIALKILSEVDAEKLGASFVALSGFLVEFAAMLKLITGLAADKNLANSIKNLYLFGSIGNALIKVAVALFIMAGAVKMLSSIDLADLAKGVGAIVVLFGILFGFLVGLDKAMKRTSELPNKLSAMAGTILIISVAVNLMARAVEKLSAMDLGGLAKGIVGVTALMGVIFGFMVGISKLGDISGGGLAAAGLGMVLIASAIEILVPAIEKLGSLDPSQISQGIIGLAFALGELALASEFMDLTGAAGLLIASLGMEALAHALKTIGSLDIEQIKNGLIGLAGALALFMAAATIMAIFPEIAAGMIILGEVMMSFGIAVALVGAGLVAMGAGLSSIAVGIASLASLSQVAVATFISTIQMMLKAIISLMPTVAVYFAEAFVTFIEQIAELAPRLKEAVVKIVDVAIEAFAATVPKVVRTGISFIIWFLHGIAEATREISGTVVEIIAAFIQGVADQQEAIIEAGFSLILSFINGLADGIRNHKDDVKDAIVNLGEAMLEAFCSFFGIASPSKVMKEQGANLMKGLIQGIKQHASKVANTLVKAVKSGLTSVKNFVKSFGQAGVSIITNLIKGVKNKVGEIAKSITNGLSKAVTAVKNYASNFIQAGWSLVQGIAQGIRNGLSSVISAVGSIAQQALNWFKQKLGINSPSKEFAKLGVGIPEGIVKGINNGSSMLKHAMHDVTDSSLNAMRDAIAKTTDELQNGGDMNPVISPVLDLSDIIKKQSELDSMLGDKTYDLAYSTSRAAALSEQSLLLNSMNKLTDNFNKISKQLAASRPNSIVNNVTVDGAENPEIFANRFVRQLELEMRT